MTSSQSVTKSPHVPGAYQWTYSRGNRKCILTRMGRSKWVARCGFASDTEIGPLHGGEFPLKRMAVRRITDWLERA